MASRKRGIHSLPSELASSSKYSSKKDLGNSRRSLPECPTPTISRYRRDLTGYMAKPRPVYFKTPVSLDDGYDPDKQITYLNQMYESAMSIGEGSFGQVYRVRSRQDNELYAIKKIRSCVKFADRFYEIQNYEKLGEHPNIVRYFMAWEEGGELFMKLEYCDISLEQFSVFCFHFPESFLNNLLYDISSALRFIHGQCFIHLDVKPANLMVKQSIFKLADFGIMADLTKGDVVKTLSEGDAKYLATEVLSGVYHPACDIFGLGISVLELSACIQLPSHGPAWREIRDLILPEEFDFNATRELRSIVRKMLDPNHLNRPTAEKVMAYANMRGFGQVDENHPREDYYRTVKADMERQSLERARRNAEEGAALVPPDQDDQPVAHGGGDAGFHTPPPSTSRMSQSRSPMHPQTSRREPSVSCLMPVAAGKALVFREQLPIRNLNFSDSDSDSDQLMVIDESGDESNLVKEDDDVTDESNLVNEEDITDEQGAESPVGRGKLPKTD